MSGAFEGSAILLAAVAVGVCLGALYDLFRIRRIAFASPDSFGVRQTPIPLEAWREHPPKTGRAVWIFVEDILFAFAAAILFLLLFYGTNQGRLRWYGFASAGVSFALYRMTVGRIVMRFADLLIRWIHTLFRLLWRGVVCRIFRAISFPVCAVWYRLQGVLRRRSTERKKKKWLALAAKGLFPKGTQIQKKT